MKTVLKTIIVLLTINLTCAQQDSVPLGNNVTVNFSVRMGNLHVVTDSVQVNLINLNNKAHETMYMHENFTLNFKKSGLYRIEITHVGHNKRAFILDTDCPDHTNYVIDLNVYLYMKKDNDPDAYLSYDKATDNYVMEASNK